MVWYEKLGSFAAILYELRTVSHVRVGSGENIKLPTPVDNPQTRILRLEPGRAEGKWIVYIPASSLHGVLRSATEDYIRTQLSPYGSKIVKNLENVTADDLKNANVDINDWNNFLRKVRSYSESIPGFGELPLYREVCYTTLEFDACQVPPASNAKKYYLTSIVGRRDSSGAHLPCFVCQLFGAAGLRGRVRILNAYPSKETTETLPLDVITRVGINRVTGAAEEGRLFDLEAIPPGAVFYFFVMINNAFDDVKLHCDAQDPQECKEEEEGRLKHYKERLGVDGDLNYIALFEKSIELVSKGLVPIGAHGTVGFGNVEITELARFEVTNEGEAREFVRILAKRMDSKESELKSELRKFLRSKKAEIPELDPDLYPWLARALAELARSKAAESPQSGASG
ncbi:MAG: RAMP superfamily CRISPR-associated protein [Thermofilum sp.]|nr:RAMP superfamily CRISPR-associated protein [Thermofilum sp.]